MNEKRRNINTPASFDFQGVPCEMPHRLPGPDPGPAAARPSGPGVEGDFEAQPLGFVDDVMK